MLDDSNLVEREIQTPSPIENIENVFIFTVDFANSDDGVISRETDWVVIALSSSHREPRIFVKWTGNRRTIDTNREVSPKALIKVVPGADAIIRPVTHLWQEN